MNFNQKVRELALRLISNNNTVLASTEPKVYVALLTQTGTDAPVATVLQNTLGGTVVWSRGGAGNYIGTLAGAFPLDKTALFINSGFDATDWDGSGNFKIVTLRSTGSENSVHLNVVTIPDGLIIELNDDLLDNTMVKIEVYP